MAGNVCEEAAGLVNSLRGEKPLAVYHWDADGIIAATLIVMAHGDAFLEPPRFTYKLVGEHLERIKKASKQAGFIVVVDLSWDPLYLETLALETGLKVVVMDHHYSPWSDYSFRGPVFYCNPAARGDPEGSWPSASYLVSRLYGVSHNLLVAASIVGDLGEAAVENKVYKSLMESSGLDPVKDYWLPREAVMQLYGVEVMGRFEALTWLPKAFATGNLDPFKAIIGDAFLATLRTQAEVEFESLLEEARKSLKAANSEILYVSLEGEGRFFSRLARELARDNPDRIVVVAYYARATGEARVYARTLRKEPALTGAVKYLREKGYSVGGKYQGSNNVIAVETSRDALEGTLREVIDALKRIT